MTVLVRKKPDAEILHKLAGCIGALSAFMVSYVHFCVDGFPESAEERLARLIAALEKAAVEADNWLVANSFDRELAKVFDRQMARYCLPKKQASEPGAEVAIATTLAAI